ncbi:MAG: ectonucleotide pyrophosphatase/phosphodiesterase [Acidobacteriota bacterium]|nr:ectonucleotide pyrophosphatase/phosphodiesterase [Acidobacteriota bacterium]
MQRFKRIFILLILVIPFAVPAQKPVEDLKPTVILISIDGFRSDYLERYKPKYLNILARTGVRAKWMTPSFPTKTFPNHYTIATGLYPENHGIVANNIYDPVFDAVFTLGKREEVMNERWWGGEPIWVTAEKQGQTAAAFFFPGTETKIKGVRPTIWNAYDGDVPNKTRVKTLLSWFDLPAAKRPTMMTLYFSDVDDAGHRFSPFGKKTRKAVSRVDSLIKTLLNGLKKRRIRDKVNLVIISDHGMASVPAKNRIVLDEMFDPADAKLIFWVGEIVQIFPKEGLEDKIYESIRAKLPGTAKVYRKAQIPERYNYRKHRRIAPLLVLPDEGWILTTREKLEERMDGKNSGSTTGSHGYDNQLESMRALFIGHGPAFKNGYVSEPFRNVEVYNLMCAILGLTPASNDGDLNNIKQILKRGY